MKVFSATIATNSFHHSTECVSSMLLQRPVQTLSPLSLQPQWSMYFDSGSCRIVMLVFLILGIFELLIKVKSGIFSVLFLLQDFDAWSYTDDPSDKNVDFADIETSEGIERLDKFSNVAEDSERFQISSFAATLMINHTLAAVGKDDELISTSGFANLKKRVRSKAKRNHERKCRRLRVFKFDGKQSKNAVGKGRFKKKTNITVIQEPEPQYVEGACCYTNGRRHE